MLSSDLDSAEDTAASAPNYAEGEEQDEEEDSPAESDVLEEEVDVHMQTIHYPNFKKNLKNVNKNLLEIALIIDLL